jgi:hypothetical protein
MHHFKKIMILKRVFTFPTKTYFPSNVFIYPVFSLNVSVNLNSRLVFVISVHISDVTVEWEFFSKLKRTLCIFAAILFYFLSRNAILIVLKKYRETIGHHSLAGKGCAETRQTVDVI